MTIKLVVAGLHSLRVCTPGLVFFGVALVLVVLPKRLSAAAGTGTAIAASAAALLAIVVAPSPVLPERTDLLKSRLSEFGPIWLMAVAPMLVACLQRSTSIDRGVAVAAVHLALGALCFAMAAKTPSLLVLSLTLSLIGAAAIPLASAIDVAGSRLAMRWALFSAVMWAMLLIGASLAAGAAPDQAPLNAGRRIGAVLAMIALFGIVGWGPTSGWMLTGNIGVRTATATVGTMIATIGFVKFRALIHIESTITVVWAWSMASLLFYLGSLRTTRFDDFASAAIGLWTSAAVGMFATAHGQDGGDVAVGAFSLLLFVSILGPALGAAIDSCTLNLAGDLGRPRDARSFALKTSLFLFTGLPLSLGFWGMKLLATSAVTGSELAGMRQATMGTAFLGSIAIGFGGLRQWARLNNRPWMPPIDDECRWQVGASIAGAAVLILVGLWPATVFSALHEIVHVVPSVLPAAPLKP